MSDSQRLQAKFVIVSPDEILCPGQLLVRNGKIAEVTSDCRNPPDLDFGQQVIIPGLINCHTHLEFSDLQSPFAAGASFPGWIRSVLSHRRQQENQTGEAEFLQIRQQAIRSGIEEAGASGTVYLADIVTCPWESSFLQRPQADGATGHETSQFVPRLLVLPEIIGLTADRFQSTVEWAETILAQMPAASSGVDRVGISPHAPYSLLWDQLQLVFKELEEPPVTAMHVAESLDELEWLEAAEGAFADSFRGLNIPFPKQRPTIGETIAFLKQRRRSLLVHGNYLTPDQIHSLSGAHQLSVVYCPRTHRHFGHSPYPLRDYQRAGVRVVLGTDSKASNPDLNLWSEVVSARQAHAEWDPRMAFASVTSQAAEALGIQAEYGTLNSGRYARFNLISAEEGWTTENLIEAITGQHLLLRPWSAG